MMRFACVVALLALVSGPCLAATEDTREKCCAPEAFEVELRATSSGGKGQPEDDKRFILFVYERKYERWALTVDHRKDPSKSSRIVADHKQGKMYLQTPDGCFATPLTGEFAPFCIQENSTFFGEYSYGREGHSLPFEVWGYNSNQAPLRINSKVTTEHCIPIQDDIFGLGTGNFRITSTHPPCNPWEHPEKLLKGDCYKCFYKIPVMRRGPTAAYHVVHIQYTNFFRGLHRVPRFDVGQHCKEVDQWDPEVVELTDIQKLFILKMKKN